MRGVLLLAAGILLVATLAHAQPRPDAAAVARGAALAEARQCAHCHGADGVSAMAHSPSLAGQHVDFSVVQMVLFREGIRRVPVMQAAMAGLSDGQIEDIAAWIASLPHAPPPDRGPRDMDRFTAGQKFSAAMNCGACHGNEYRGQANVPRIAGQREDFLARTLREYRDNIRVGADTQMNGAMLGVDDAAIAALAHYLAQQ